VAVITMDDRPDSALVAEVLAGQREAFCTLVRRYQDYAYGVAVGIVSDFDLAQDVVQEAFLSAYCDLAKLRDPARFGGWLRGIVRNTAHHALRDREQASPLDEDVPSIAQRLGRAQSPEEMAEQAERRAVVRQALERVGARNREVVSLYYIDGLSYADIAGFLNVSRETVKGRLQRGRAQLREELLMVEDTFREQRLPDDFAAEIKRLLDTWAARGVESKQEIERLAKIGPPAVDLLCEALADPRPAVHRAAANALCAIGDPRALGPILKAWKASRWHRRFQSARVLGVPGVREECLKALREGDRNDQWWAVEALSHAKGDDEAFDAVYQVFRDPQGERIGALEALCDIRPEAAVGVIVEALGDADLRLRADAAWTAVKRGLLPPIDACLKAFVGGADWGARCAAALVLKHGEEGVTALERVLHTGSRAERVAAALALAHRGDREAFEVLLGEIIRDRQGPSVETLLRALAAHYGPQSAAWMAASAGRLAEVPALVRALARSRATVRDSTIEMLLRDPRPSVRTAAVKILARQRGAGFLLELRRRLREGRPGKVAREAFWQMLWLRDAALPTAQAMLDSEHWTERKAAVALLRRWGKLTPDQQAQATKDPHVAVRVAARWWHQRWERPRNSC
jgi:RNA polymerase sigma-70 factor (ECF subfamily)